MVVKQRRLIGFVVASFALVAILTLFQQQFDGVLAVERFRTELDLASEQAQLPNLDILPALVYAESRGNESAVSSIGALGLCQVLPTTAAELAERYQLPGPPWSPAQNLELGAYYLAQLLNDFSGDLELAVLAYRLGPAHVSRKIVEAGSILSYKQSLRRRKPSTWEYLTQIKRFTDRFEERRLALNP